MSSETMAIIGHFVLWVGWLSFNASGSRLADEESKEIALQAVMNTIVASSFAGTVGLILELKWFQESLVITIINSILIVWLVLLDVVVLSLHYQPRLLERSRPLFLWEN